jgi:hypothetical protein
MKSIELEGGIELPYPTRARGFKQPKDVGKVRWRTMKQDMWFRCYTHCLFSLHNQFELPMHTIVPNLAKNMLEASEPLLVALRFMGEMLDQKYIRINRGFNRRVVVPTRKLLDLDIASKDGPDNTIVMPRIVGVDYLSKYVAVRGGIRNHNNIKAAKVVNRMAEEKFVVNEFILELLKKYPVEDDDITKGCMYARTLATAEKLKDESFRFPYFLDSRSRMYVTTTCGVSPQGADYEKALLLPVYSEKLTQEGLEALHEAALGYSEISWSIQEMINHARDPDQYLTEWKKADKPYSYMACANLLKMHEEAPDRPLPAFIPLDGRCSGLQHWSAVVRSNAITRHLGMHEEEADKDIYEKVAADWEDTLPDELKYLATRKAAKIPVMTWGYNATQMTSTEHMDKLYGNDSKWSTEVEAFVPTKEGFDRATTNQLGRDIYEQLNKTLGPLTEAVVWVSNAASKIAKAGNVSIDWTSPDGFQCTQRKVKGVPKQLEVVLSSGEVFGLDVKDFSENLPNPGKHRSAIAPNIIHSLDATHLRMVAKELDKLGVPMVFIHDSFATHCNYRKPLYDKIIDTFIKLYSVNYLEMLKTQWEGQYKVNLDDIPELGNWEPESLRDLKNFFM